MDVDHGGFVSPVMVIQTHHDLYLYIYLLYNAAVTWL